MCDDMSIRFDTVSETPQVSWCPKLATSTSLTHRAERIAQVHGIRGLWCQHRAGDHSTPFSASSWQQRQDQYVTLSPDDSTRQMSACCQDKHSSTPSTISPSTVRLLEGSPLSKFCSFVFVNDMLRPNGAAALLRAPKQSAAWSSSDRKITASSA